MVVPRKDRAILIQIASELFRDSAGPCPGGRGPGAGGEVRGEGPFFPEANVFWGAPKSGQGWFLTVSSTIPTFFRNFFLTDGERTTDPFWS